jgi:hypothetical protein
MDNLSGSTAAASITADISLLNQSIEHISSVITSLETLGKEKPWSQLGYFDAARDDEIEHLFFRFLISRRVLVSLALHESNTASHQQQNHNNNKIDGTFDLQRALARAEISFTDPNITDTTHALRTMIILASAIVRDSTITKDWGRCDGRRRHRGCCRGSDVQQSLSLDGYTCQPIASSSPPNICRGEDRSVDQHLSLPWR